MTNVHGLIFISYRFKESYTINQLKMVLNITLKNFVKKVNNIIVYHKQLL